VTPKDLAELGWVDWNETLAFPDSWPFMAVPAGNGKENIKIVFTLQSSNFLNMAQHSDGDQ